MKKLETLKSGFGQVKIARKFCENGCGGIVESVENLISSTIEPYILWLNLKVGHKEPCDNYTECYRKCSVFDIFKSAANLPVFQYIGKNKGNGAL